STRCKEGIRYVARTIPQTAMGPSFPFTQMVRWSSHSGMAAHFDAARGGDSRGLLCAACARASRRIGGTLPGPSTAHGIDTARRPIHAINRNRGWCTRLEAVMPEPPGTATNRRINPASEYAAHPYDATGYPPEREVRWHKSSTGW